MFGNDTAIFSVVEIKRSYPDEWVAISVQKTDADGLPSAGEVLVHNAEEQPVWQSLRLGEGDDLVHVFYTGTGQRAKGKDSSPLALGAGHLGEKVEAHVPTADYRPNALSIEPVVV